MTDSKPKDVAFNVASIVSGRNLEPYVQVEIVMPDGAVGKVQLTTQQARHQAAYILAAADAAESDHFLMSFSVDVLGAKLEAAMALVSKFREYRDMRQRQQPTQSAEVH